MNITWQYDSKMLTASPIMALQHKENHVTKHVISSSKYLLTSQVVSSKILMSGEIMSMSRDIKLKET